MMFNAATLLSALVASASFVSAAPAAETPKTGSPVVNIVYNPLITYPTAGVVWSVGETKTVTWNTAEIPEELINSTGTILLGFNENESENLDIAHPLATGFKLTDGQVNVTVPEKEDRSDYIVVLFGDSGNASPEFIIQSAASSVSSALPSETVSSATDSVVPTSSSVGVPF